MARLTTKVMIAAVLFLFAGLSAHAQATRTWVSGMGDDANPCSRTAACKTFAGAISKTAPGGEIDALDMGGFGAVTITKAITISGVGVTAGVLVAGTNAIVVAAGANDSVTLRHLDIDGLGSTGSPGLNGVRFISGKELNVDDCDIYGFSQDGIDASLTSAGRVMVKNTTITDCNIGVHVLDNGGVCYATLDGLTIRNCGTGVDGASSNTSISNSVITHNSAFGLLAEMGGWVSSTHNQITANVVGVRASANSKIRLSNNDILNNTTGIVALGTVESAANNTSAGNVTPGAPNGTITIL